jgi:tape measure domain-containing protein
MALDKTIRIKVDSSGAKKDVDSLDGSINNLDKSANQTNKSFGNLKTAVIAVAAALQVRVITQYADAFTSIQNQIRQTTNSTDELTKRTADLLAVANRSRVEFSATAELYNQLTLSTENLNLSTEEQLRLTETIAKSFSVSGKSAAESAGAIRQLGQAFAAGALRGDEFNSIAEGAPEIMRALQRSLNLTQGELRDLAATGGITSEILVTALGKAATVIDEKLVNSTKTLSQSWQEAENNAIAFVGASDLVTTSMGAAGKTLVFLSEHLDTIANVLLVAAVAGIGRLTAGFILNTVAALRSATAIGAVTVASSSLSRALSILGGPLGLILTAAAGIAIFAANSKEATNPVNGLTKEVDDLANSFKELNEGQMDAALGNAIAKVESLRAKIDAVNNNPLKGSKLLGGSENAVIKLQREFEEAIKLRDALFQAGLNKNLEGATDQSKETNDLQFGRGGAAKVEDPAPFVNNERFKTQSLRAELNERLSVQTAYNALIMSQGQAVSDQELALVKFNEAADTASLQRRREESAIDFEMRLAALLEQEIREKSELSVLREELGLQQLEQSKIFQLEQTQIEQDAADARINIARMEASEKINSLQNAGQLALNLNELFGSKSEKANKKRRKASVIVNAAAGIGRAFAEHNFYVALGISAGIAVMAKQQLSAIDGAGSVSAPSASSFSAREPAERQEPVRQSNVVEIRGLSEVANELRNLDPGQVLPVEYTQRIVASLDNYNRLSGGG